MPQRKNISKLIDGQAYARRILLELKPRVAVLRKKGMIPHLVVILVGREKPSLIYVHKKQKTARLLGMRCTIVNISKKTSEQGIIASIKKIQKQNKVTGLIVQLPLPLEINTRKVLDTIDPGKDVDCLTSTNLGKVLTGSAYILPPTPAACWELVKSVCADITGKHVVIVGSGILVGRPLSILLSHEPVTVTLCRKSTPNLASITRRADIVISGIGVPGLLKKDFFKKNAIVIDAGVSFVKGKIFGDVDLKSVISNVQKITPVSGGVGPITVAKLLENVICLAEEKV